MKLAIVGKGGAGKTTLSAALSRALVALGRPVVAVDADPDGNLASALGVPEDRLPQPIAQMRDLILKRTEAQDQGAGLIFKMNPMVEDLPERFSVDARGVRLLVLRGVLNSTTNLILARMEDGETFEEVLGRADSRLYQAKDRGRNCVVGPPRERLRDAAEG